METILSKDQLDQIRQSFETGRFSVDRQVQQLVDSGMDKTTAEKLVLDVVKTYREELFQENIQNQKNEEARKVAYMVAVCVSMIGPIFGIESPMWYLVAMGIAGCAGYYGYRDKPLAGIIGSMLVVVVFPFTYHYYLSGRSSYLNIELAIPLILAIVPAFLILLLISSVFYTDND